jgi:hypothetical protein
MPEGNAVGECCAPALCKSGEVEKVIRSKDEVRQFLLALYGGRTEAGEFGFDAV